MRQIKVNLLNLIEIEMPLIGWILWIGGSVAWLLIR
jgi:hypothetical protein